MTQGIAMFEDLKFRATPRREIVVETARGTRLRNFVSPPADFHAQQRQTSLVARMGIGWTERKGPTGGYNCAGMVWASRRTCLTEPDDWRIVLEEDGYRRLLQSEAPQVGDVAVYVSTVALEIMHVARVVELRRLTTGSSAAGAAVPWLLSKWDNQLGESFHHPQHVHLNGGEPFELQFWTDRPEGIR
jgi:hypothetical protein